MKDCFYIIESHPGWYQLIIDGIFYCVSAGSDLDLLFRIITNYVRKYRTRERMLSALSEALHNSKVSLITLQDRKENIYEQGKPYKDRIDKTVREALEENQKDSTLARNNARKKLIPLAPVRTVNDEAAEELTLDITLTDPPIEATPRKVKPLRSLHVVPISI